MSKANLTAGRVESFKCEGSSHAYLYDTQVNGLAVRALPSGRKAYILQARYNGKVIRITIGDVTAWGIEEARDKNGEIILPGARQEARRLQAEIDKGNDPREQKAERIAEAEAKREAAQHTEAPALDAWKAYIEARKGKWSDNHLADHENVAKEGGKKRTRGRRPGESEFTQPGALRGLLLKPLSAIDADTMRDWLQSEATRRPTHARLAFGLLRAFLNWCSDRKEYRDMVHVDACAARIAKDTLPKKAAKDDCLQRQQLKPWFEKVKTINNPVISTYLQVALLTGARREEIAALQWLDVDFKWNTIRMHDKVDGERTIPLTPYVSALLSKLKRINDTPPPKHRILNGKKIENDLENWKPPKWVFASKTAESGRLQEPRIQHTKACSAAEITGLTIHGLRRSFGTLAEWVECPAGIVAQIQGHKPSATAEKHYRVRPIDLLRMWHTKIEAWILRDAGIKQPKEGKSELQAVPTSATA
ncbi:MAG: integrase family protein [Azonexus sp.]|nr:integrase family protein [Azonexus sp.]